jgi:MinD superfamily P-loop ATPase
VPTLCGILDILSHLTLIFQECTNIFSSEGGRLLAEEQNIPFLGKIPIDPQLTSSCENGVSFVEKFPDSPSLKAVQQLVETLIKQTAST